MLLKLILIIVERIFISLTLSLLRDSSDFVTHLVYLLIADTFLTTFIIIFVDICIPWLRAVRIGVERDARLNVWAEGLIDPEV